MLRRGPGVVTCALRCCHEFASSQDGTAHSSLWLTCRLADLLTRYKALLKIEGRVSARCRINSPNNVFAHANQARVKSAALSF